MRRYSLPAVSHFRRVAASLCAALGSVSISTMILLAFVAGPKARSTEAVPAHATATFAGGCFWGVQAVFQHVQGVTQVVSGYAGGDANTARYEIVGLGRSGHAEAVEVTYDPEVISFDALLDIFLTVAHDPTELDAQGPDTGKQYRSVIFAADDVQRAMASKALNTASSTRPIATEIAPLNGFFRAEDYHQDFARLNPKNPYIIAHDAPKLARLVAEFPQLYRATPVETAAAN
ncbi:MAG: peptide-methionine (S)-S-oxide reductase MsrA [Hyphomicrobium sp.]